jgi:hypothetical protein
VDKPKCHFCLLLNPDENVERGGDNAAITLALYSSLRCADGKGCSFGEAVSPLLSAEKHSRRE